MPVKLNSSTERLHGGRINEKMVLEMVNYYRANRRKDSASLKFAHFTAVEVLQLFADNGIIDQPTTAQITAAAPYGVKIYMANHANDPASCPEGRQTTYNLSDTVIICNTKLSSDTYTDMLTDDQDSVSIPGAGDKVIEAETGLDKGSICPPDCPPVADVTHKFNVDISNVS